jgi:hypothetical protein
MAISVVVVLGLFSWRWSVPDTPAGDMRACSVLKPPKPDPALNPFRGGVAVLTRDGEVAGHVATNVKTFWAPFSFSLRRQWWVWYVVVWANGDRERSEEDYPPWSVVAEMQSGTFTWDADDVHHGHYAVGWLTNSERDAALVDLGIERDDF